MGVMSKIPSGLLIPGDRASNRIGMNFNEMGMSESTYERLLAVKNKHSLLLGIFSQQADA